MHKRRDEALALLREVGDGAAAAGPTVEVVVAPPYPYLELAVRTLEGSGVQVAAQNCHEAAQGAYTGEVSASMLAGIGVTHCIVGHSERRQYYGENDAAVGLKVRALLAHGLTPIYCCGELKDDRIAERHFEVVGAQMEQALGAFSPEELGRLVVAYEPVWAIGTGLNATAAQAQEMHAFIRRQLGAAAAHVPILYGGSCKPDNAEGLFKGADVNGGLIGGAALEASSFLELVRIAYRVKHSA